MNTQKITPKFQLFQKFYILDDDIVLEYIISKIALNMTEKNIMYDLDYPDPWAGYISINNITENELIEGIGKRFFSSYEKAEKFYEDHKTDIEIEKDKVSAIDGILSRLKRELNKVKNNTPTTDFYEKIKAIRKEIDNIVDNIYQDETTISPR